MKIAAAAVATTLLMALAPLGTLAQDAAPPHPTPRGAAGDASPSLPEGPGTISGRILHKRTRQGAAGVELALYALKPDGSPGVGGVTTKADGSFRFDGLSNDPAVVYLLGARYREVPFGRRVRFAADQTQLDVDVEIDEATSDASALALEASTLTIDWMGNELLITERLTLQNAGDRVINVPSSARATDEPVFELALPAAAHAFQTGFESFGQSLDLQEGGRLVHWGPIFPGKQELVYQYRLPTPRHEGAALEIRERFPTGVSSLQVLVADTGIEVQRHNLSPAEPVEIEGRNYQAFDLGSDGPLDPGTELELSLVLPALRSDPDSLSLTRSDYWLELDDASLTISSEQQLEIEPGARLIGSPESPLVSFALPEGAELLGVTNQAASLGVRPGEDRIDVLGPLEAGVSTIAYRYRVPAGPIETGTDVDLRFPLDTALVNVLVADTGVEVSSDRLHRQRPFRNGTRLYLHREAFQVTPDESIRIHVRPLARGGIPPAAALGGAFAALAIAAWFVAAPLRDRDRQGPDPGEADTFDERERVYENIRDLDHDFETGKIAEPDYVEMRGELRHRAIELLRTQRQTQKQTRKQTEPPPPAATRGAFCPNCGERVTEGWKFCSGCGETLDPKPATPSQHA